jgi:hypothetical protein
VRCLPGDVEVSTMKQQTIEKPAVLELSSDDLQLVQAGLRLLLVVEDDRIMIEGLKDLLARVDREIAARTE